MVQSEACKALPLVDFVVCSLLLLLCCLFHRGIAPFPVIAHMATPNAATAPHLVRHREVFTVNGYPSAAVAPFARREFRIRRTGAEIVGLCRLPPEFHHALVAEFDGLRVDGKIRLGGRERRVERRFEIVCRHDREQDFRPR